MKTSVYLFIIISTTSFSVFATENLELDNDPSLLSSCQTLSVTPEQTNEKYCFHFFQGFLTAAQALEPLIIKKQINESRMIYSFMGRPYRPMHHISTAPSLLFCISENESDSSVIKVISKQLPTQNYTKKMLKNILLTALKIEYPCEKA